MRNWLLGRAVGDEIDIIMTHPRHQQAVRTIAELIAHLRQCRQPEDFHGFQDRLLGLVLEIEARRSEISRVVKRLKKPGGTVPRDAPELGTDLDPNKLESWALEDEVFERIWRQYKSIGDALAWRAFRYDRRIIVALSRNERPGLMHGKAGLAAERAQIDAAWQDNRQFALLHDLTDALRVGDVSVFRPDGAVIVEEAKTNNKYRIGRQDRLVLDTSTVLADGGTLPSGFAPISTGVPYATNLGRLRDLLGLAHARTGVQGGVVSSGRAVVAVSLYTAHQHHTADTFGAAFAAELARCRRKIGVPSPEAAAIIQSVDQVSRSATRPPWAIYPLAPSVAAALTADAMFFFVCMSPDTIVSRLADVGVSAEWMQPHHGPYEWSKPLLRVAAKHGRRHSGTSINPEAIASLLLEAIDLPTWCRQVAHTLGQADLTGVRPWPCFADECKTWA